jgi:hypothetical protein
MLTVALQERGGGALGLNKGALFEYSCMMMMFT